VNRTVRFHAVLILSLAAVGVVDLQRGVLQLVLAVRDGFDVGAHGVAVHVAGDQDVLTATADPR
jgi:hypothetical protein